MSAAAICERRARRIKTLPGHAQCRPAAADGHRYKPTGSCDISVVDVHARGRVNDEWPSRALLMWLSETEKRSAERSRSQRDLRAGFRRTDRHCDVVSGLAADAVLVAVEAMWV